MKRFIREYACHTDWGCWPGWLIGFACLCLLLLPQTAAAQQDSLLSVWAEFLEEDAGLLDNIYFFLENPVNINRASKNELLRLPFLIPQQADSILSYRHMHRRIRRKGELKKIVGSWTYRLIKDFIVLKSQPPQALRLIHRTGYPFDPSAAYSYGSSFSDYNKVYIQLNQNLRAGLVTQKDPGETSFADYISGFIHYQHKDWQIIAGKYYPEFGEGLLFSNPFSGLKSANGVTVFGSGLNRVHPSVSSYENGGMFGLYVQASPFNNFSVSLLAGNNFRDARFGADGRTVIGLDYDGYHRNPAELKAKNAVREQVVGFIADKIINRYLRMAALISRFKFSPGITYAPQSVTEKEYRKNIFHFSGEALSNGSLAYFCSWRHFSFKGEGAFSHPGGGYAFAQSLLLRSPSLSWGVKIWRASNNFQSPAGRLFDDQTPFPRGQQGIYTAAAFRPEKRINVSAYHIFKKDLWRGYFNDMPQWQSEWLLQSVIKTNSARLLLRLRRKTAPQEAVAPQPSTSGLNQQWLYRIQLLIPVQRDIRWSMRWQHTSLSPRPESGSYLFQDLLAEVGKQWTLSCRITVFRTSSYLSRLYEYERDLPGSFANYALYGEGYKWYFLLAYILNPSVRFWVKYRYLRQNRKDLLTDSFEQQATRNRLLRVQLQLNF